MANDNSNGKTQGAKVPKPFAPRSGELPPAPHDCAWDTTEIGPWQFAILVAKSLVGVELLAGSHAKAVGLFNRAWRILVPAAIDARGVKKDAMNAAWAEKVQQQIINFDPAAVKTRAVRTPPTVEVPKDKQLFTLDELRAMFGDRIQIVQK